MSEIEQRTPHSILPFNDSAARGDKAGLKVIHMFGHNDSIGTTITPVAQGGVYQTPTTAVSLEFVSSSANDTAAGTGAQEMTIIGLDANWNEQEVTVATNGTTAAAISGTWLRVYKAYVSASGTYATSAAGSHAGNLTIRVAGAGATYAYMTVSPFPEGQSNIGAYTVPIGKTAFIKHIYVHVDTNKEVDVYAFQRPEANDVTTPYSPMKVWGQWHGIASNTHLHPHTPYGPFVGPCDLGFMAVVDASTGDTAVDVEIWEYDY